MTIKYIKAIYEMVVLKKKDGKHKACQQVQVKEAKDC